MAVVDPLLAALASHVLARPSGDVIGNTSLNNLRSKLKLLLATLELSQRNFSGYSLRRGGAANAFASGTNFYIPCWSWGGGKAFKLRANTWILVEKPWCHCTSPLQANG